MVLPLSPNQEIAAAISAVRQKASLEYLLGDAVRFPSSAKRFLPSVLSEASPFFLEHLFLQHQPAAKKAVEAGKTTGAKMKASVENGNGRDDDSSEELDTNLNFDDSPSITYSFHEEEFLVKEMYKATPLDYTKLFYGDTKKIPPQFAQDSEYMTERAIISDTEREMLTTQEASAMLIDIQYATSVGAHSDVNPRERAKFDLWIKFNKSLFGLFQSMYAVTSEIDYSRVS